MRIARSALEITIFLTALVATLIAAVLILSIGMVPHTVKNGNDIDAAFLKASEFINQRIQSTGRTPQKIEFNEWRSSQGLWASRIELTRASASGSEIQARFGTVPADAYVLSMWRGEWSEYYVQGKGSTVDSASGLYLSFIGRALGACGLSATLWIIARKLKRSNSRVAR